MDQNDSSIEWFSSEPRQHFFSSMEICCLEQNSFPRSFHNRGPIFFSSTDRAVISTQETFYLILKKNSFRRFHPNPRHGTHTSFDISDPKHTTHSSPDQSCANRLAGFIDFLQILAASWEMSCRGWKTWFAFRLQEKIRRNSLIFCRKSRVGSIV